MRFKSMSTVGVALLLVGTMTGCLGGPEDLAGDPSEEGVGAPSDGVQSQTSALTLPNFCSAFTDDLNLDPYVTHSATGLCMNHTVDTPGTMTFDIEVKFPDLDDSASKCVAASVHSRLHQKVSSGWSMLLDDTTFAKKVSGHCVAKASYVYFHGSGTIWLNMIGEPLATTNHFKSIAQTGF